MFGVTVTCPRLCLISLTIKMFEFSSSRPVCSAWLLCLVVMKRMCVWVCDSHQTPSSQLTERKERGKRRVFLWVTGNTGKRKGRGNRRLSLAPLAGDGLDSLCGERGHSLVWREVAALSRSSPERSEAGDQPGLVHPPAAS